MTTTRFFTVLATLALGAGVALAQDSADGGTDTATPATDPGAVSRRQEIDERAATTLNELLEGTEGASGLYDRAAGYAVFTATKAGGFFVTGGRGTGVAVNKASGERTYMRLGTGGVGFGIGAQRYDLVILFETDTQLQRFIQGGWDASASAQAAAGSDGVAINSSFVDGVAFFQLTNRGLMAQADISGTRFWPIDDLN